MSDIVRVEFVREKEWIALLEEQGEVVYIEPGEGGKEVIVKDSEVIVAKEWSDGWLLITIDC